jgi:hypothetical protein
MRAPSGPLLALVETADMDYVTFIEFRPNDLASPRLARLT